MKKRFLIFSSIACWPLLASPQTVYNGYEAYYSTQNNLFTTTIASHFSGSRNAVVHWQGKRIALARAKGFPGEFTVNDDLGSDAKIYERRSSLALKATPREQAAPQFAIYPCI